MLAIDVDERLDGILRGKAVELGCVLVAFGAASDHVHVILQLACTAALAGVVGPMKGLSAFLLNRDAGAGERLVWQEGYWAESIEPGFVATASRYALRQRTRHQQTRAPERWELATISPPTPREQVSHQRSGSGTPTLRRIK